MEPNLEEAPLDQFLDLLYGGLDGYIYLAAKNPTLDPGNPKYWLQEFFEWPTAASTLKQAIRSASSSHEIYLAPALFIDPTKGAVRENFKVSNVVWTEFDGNAPETHIFGDEPSIIVQSSSESNQHVYWRTAEPISDVDTIENINKRIAYNWSADPSAWDAIQVLRPPETINHKRGTNVELIRANNVSYDIAIFDALAPVPNDVNIDGWELKALPNVDDVVLRYSFPPDLILLFKKEKEQVKDRSVSLMNAAYGCCQLGLSDAECFVILMWLDDKWEKFKYRKDREKQLARIITRARNKYPDVLPTAEEEASVGNDNPILILGYRTFMAAEIEIDWVLEGMLMEQGNMLMAGPSGIGKTQISLQFMKHVALGKDFLHYKVPSPKKVLFLSLEMGHPDLQIFLRAQDAALTDDERDLLEQNLIIIPHGESWALNQPQGQDQLKRILDEFEPEGLFVDSIGSAILGNINSNEVVQPLTNFNDHIRNKYNLFTWYIHHTRKAGPGSNGRVDQDDIYGDQYLVNRCSSAYGVLRGKDESIKIRNFKNRLSKKEDDYLLKRTEDLNFIKLNQPIDDLTHQLSTTESDKSNGPTAGGFNL